MRLKNNPRLAAVLAASEERAQGRRPVSSAGLSPMPSVSVGRQYRILGLDTALRKTGWGIIDATGGHFRAVDCGVVLNDRKVSVSDCLRRLNGALKGLLNNYHPDIAVIEGGFFCKNARTAIILGTARGAVLGVLAEAQIEIYEYAPRRVKQMVCGFGNASKGQVALLVAQFLQIKVDNLSDDTTDALALALCHAQLLGTAHGLSLGEPL